MNRYNAIALLALLASSACQQSTEAASDGVASNAASAGAQPSQPANRLQSLIVGSWAIDSGCTQVFATYEADGNFTIPGDGRTGRYTLVGDRLSYPNGDPNDSFRVTQATERSFVALFDDGASHRVVKC